MHEESFFGDPRSWVAIAFVIFFAIFGRTLFKALAAMLDKRSEAIRAQLAEAQRLRQEAEAMLKDATMRRDAAAVEATRLLAGARVEADRVAHAAAEEAEASAQRREKMAMDRIAAAEKAAVDSVRIAAAELAVIASEQVIRESLTGDLDASLIDGAIAGLPAALAKRAA